jgi:hypothetical protein
MDLSDFRRPVNVISIIIGVLGIVVSLITYHISHERRELAYSIPHFPSKLFDSRSSSPKLILVGPNGRPISQDVYLSEIVLWNSGTLPIEPADIRRQILLRISGPAQILDWKVIRETDPDITQAQLYLETSATPPTTSLHVQWKHLDPGAGLRFQVIYTGTDSSRAYLQGSVLGLGDLRKLPDRAASPPFNWPDSFNLFSVMAVLIACIYVYRRIFVINMKADTKWIILLVLVGYMLTVLWTVIYQLNKYFNAAPL